MRTRELSDAPMTAGQLTIENNDAKVTLRADYTLK